MAVFIMFRVALLIFAQTKASQVLHDRLLERVFNAPINLFYDITPIGKILNRFSGDLAPIDDGMFFDFGTMLALIYQILAALLIACIAVPYLIVVIILFAIFGWWLFSYSVKAYKECYRLSQVAMSPVLSFFQETFSGSTVIRAFRKEEEFKNHTFSMINRQAVAN